ncbi:MAG: signal peptidase I [Bacteroidales bacterium]|nr:signal peptidase I [Bacteroidales bacterium]MBN2820509.1 signal peptidase I [Bacteroidales bacterium]
MAISFLNRTKHFLQNPFFKLLLTSAIYTFWVLWLETYWLFFGLIIITDVQLTRFVNWRFWRKRLPKGKKHKKITELFDSLVWAVLIAVFIRIFLFEAYSIPTSSMEKTLLVGDYIVVNKLIYGPRYPMTPVTIPFTHNTLPGKKTRNSFVSSVQWKYNRLRGFGNIQHNDVVVFNYPEGDTIIQQLPDKSYYSMIRQYGYKPIKEKYDLLYRPVDKRDNYVKRVIGLPGDTIKIQHGVAYINGRAEKHSKSMQFNYSIKMMNEADTSLFNTLDISWYDVQINEYNSIYTVPLTSEGYHHVIDSGIFKAIVKYENIDPTETSRQIFPFNKRYTWTEDNFGPVEIPSRGYVMTLNLYNLPLYERIIRVYEGNNLEVKNNYIYINGILQNTYTFKMNYYFMLGDNRHNSNDSRYWGFVPEDHIIGKAKMVWLSVDKTKKFPHNIRWNKTFKFIH